MFWQQLIVVHTRGFLKGGRGGARAWGTGETDCMGLLIEINQNQEIIEAFFLSTSFVHANVNVLSGTCNGAFY